MEGVPCLLQLKQFSEGLHNVTSMEIFRDHKINIIFYQKKNSTIEILWDSLAFCTLLQQCYRFLNFLLSFRLFLVLRQSLLIACVSDFSVGFPSFSVLLDCLRNLFFCYSWKSSLELACRVDTSSRWKANVVYEQSHSLEEWTFFIGQYSSLIIGYKGRRMLYFDQRTHNLMFSSSICLSLYNLLWLPNVFFFIIISSSWW